MPKLTTSMDKVIGLRVRTSRAECGMTQEKLGNALGLTFQQVQKYEKGTNRISTSTMLVIARTLNKPVSYFIDEPKYKPNTKGEAMAEFMASRLGVQLISEAVELHPALQQNLLDIARTMNRTAT
jgi:transcriptional regulator with XRE-family HTH domain